MPTINGSDISKVVVACEAGMGSSVMLTAQMQKRLKPYDIEVVHSPVNQVPDDADLILCHTGLSSRAKSQAPDTVVKPFNMFMGDPVFDQLENAIKNGEDLES